MNGTALDELVRYTGRSRVSTHADEAIVLEELAKTYPDGTEAVRGISLRVASGESYGILGPNGAGKSTLIGMLGTLVRPTGGRALGLCRARAPVLDRGGELDPAAEAAGLSLPVGEGAGGRLAAGVELDRRAGGLRPLVHASMLGALAERHNEVTTEEFSAGHRTPKGDRPRPKVFA